MVLSMGASIVSVSNPCDNNMFHLFANYLQ